MQPPGAGRVVAFRPPRRRPPSVFSFRPVQLRLPPLRAAPAPMGLTPSPTSFSSLRPLLLRLARLGSSFPIEVIVTTFCAVTLVYFQLLKVSRLSAAAPAPSVASAVRAFLGHRAPQTRNRRGAPGAGAGVRPAREEPGVVARAVWWRRRARGTTRAGKVACGRRWPHARSRHGKSASVRPTKRS